MAPSSGIEAADPGSIEARAARLDALLRVVAPEGATLFAVGGCGRRELAPGSDVDLLVLHDGGANDAIARMARTLWDAGLELGHAVRDRAGLSDALRSDLAAATATLEGRWVVGERRRLAVVREVVAEFLDADRDRFVSAKLAEADERHARRGDRVCLLVPNLKDGRGALRDLQLLRLLAALVMGPLPRAEGSGDAILPALGQADELLRDWLELDPEELAGLEQAHATLHAVRSALHEVGTVTDRLDLESQHVLAERLGFQDRDERMAVEAFMDQVYRSATHVDRLLGRARLALQGEAPEDFRARPLAAGVGTAGDEMLLLQTPEPEQTPARLAELFRQSQRTKRRLAASARERVRRALRGISAPVLRADSAVVAGLREVLGGGQGVAACLRDMHDSGYLGVVLPEFGALDCLSQADPYHAYTVDEHTLAVLSALEGQTPSLTRPLAAGSTREDLRRAELLLGATRRDLLRLGILLHDAGKVGGSLGHTERGVALVPAVAWRLGLSAEEERHVKFLVREHLTFSRMAEKRDVDAPDTVGDLLAIVRHDRERLDHLYLLTCADIAGVSSHAMTRWKDHLLTRLYDHAVDALAQGEVRVARPRDVEAWCRLFEGQVDPQRLRAHFERCGRDYLADVEPDEVLVHLELAQELEADGILAARFSLDEGCERLWINSYDRPRLFADLCGTLTACQHEILGATTHDCTDGTVFDRFALALGDERERPQRWEGLVRTLREVLRGDRTTESLLAARHRREPPQPVLGKRPGVRIRISNDTSPGLSMVDVSAPDRLGLLYDLAGVISRLDCDIRLAKVATKGDRVIDVFHVSAPGGGQLDRVLRRRLLHDLGLAARGQGWSSP